MVAEGKPFSITSIPTGNCPCFYTQTPPMLMQATLNYMSHKTKAGKELVGKKGSAEMGGGMEADNEE